MGYSVIGQKYRDYSFYLQPKPYGTSNEGVSEVGSFTRKRSVEHNYLFF